MNIATTLKNAAQTTAWCGFRTRVETIVAIEFAASWKPFMKSKASASSTSTTITVRLISTACMALAADQEFSRMMPSTMLATSSQRSVTDSRSS
jgi:hypothetical protein